MAACPVCGVDESALTLGDATDAIRTFPRRFREGLAVVPGGLVGIRPEGEAASMLGFAVLAREQLELLAGYLPSVLAGGEPAFPPGNVAVARPGWAVNTDLVLAGITAACDDLVAQITDVPLAAWSRPFTIGDDAHTAIWIPRRAAHDGAHHLRDLTRVHAIVAADDDQRDEN